MTFLTSYAIRIELSKASLRIKRIFHEWINVVFRYSLFKNLGSWIMMEVVIVPLLEVSDEMEQLWNIYYVCIGDTLCGLKKELYVSL